MIRILYSLVNKHTTQAYPHWTPMSSSISLVLSIISMSNFNSYIMFNYIGDVIYLFCSRRDKIIISILFISFYSFIHLFLFSFNQKMYSSWNSSFFANVKIVSFPRVSQPPCISIFMYLLQLLLRRILNTQQATSVKVKVIVTDQNLLKNATKVANTKVPIMFSHRNN